MQIVKYVINFFNGLKNNSWRLLYPQLRYSFSINSHLTNEERVTLYSLSKNLSIVAEIGSYVGASACSFGASAVSSPDMKIICIDTWSNDAMSEGFRDTWSEFQQNTSPYSQFIIPVKGYSADIIERVRAITQVVDLLFIDGDHSYSGVKADWDNYSYFLRPGSIVVFHDYGWAEGVRRVVHEDVLPLVRPHGCLPNMWWGTLSGQS